MSQGAASTIGTIALVIGGAAGALSLLDWMLTKKARAAINNKAASLWIWLSYQKTWPYIRALRSRRAFSITLAAALAYPVLFYSIVPIFLGVNIFRLGGGDSFSLFFPGIIVAFVGLPCLVFLALRRRILKLYLWATDEPTTSQYLLRAIGLWLGAVLAALIINAPSFTAVFMLEGEIGRTAYVVLFWAVWVIGWISMLVFMLGSLMAIFMALYIAVIFLMIGLFKIGEFIALRIAEYERGAILAVVAAFTAIGAVLKALA